MLDADLAQLYGVETRVLVQAVKRNLARFPQDFMFQLPAEGFANLRSHSRSPPNAALIPQDKDKKTQARKSV